jgi:RNA polymerase sigma factor (sigma-70 family)
MKETNPAPADLELVLQRFSNSIKASILKFGLDKRGIDPEDVFQEVRIKIWKKLVNEKKVTNHSSYINRIVNSTLIDCIRSSRRQERLIWHEKQKSLLQGECHQESAPEGNVFSEKISQATDSLLESRRTVVKMFLSDMDIEEISLVLKWSKDKTRNLLYRGLSDLKSKLLEMGIEYEPR